MNTDPTWSDGEAPANRTLAALSLALASGVSLGEVEIDLSDPEQCRFGAYTLIERLGGGGMGVVYRARQESLERDVAIKLLNLHLGADEQAQARFRFEARSAAALNHPNIVQVYEIGQQQGIAFIAMQLVRGKTLAASLREERPSPQRTVALLLRLCEAVGYAHRLHLLHLDLKPSNILLDERGEPLVADFGLARAMDDKGQVQAQEVSGTPAYMAPEQVLIKQYRLSAQTDIYALGAIAYEMLCGISPHGTGNPADVMQRALAGQIRPPREFLPRPPRDLEAIAMKCLALRAADRYASVEALAEDLRHYANGLPVSVRRPGLRERMQRWYVREPRFALAMTALLNLAMAAAVVTSWLYHQASLQRAGANAMVAILTAQTQTGPRFLKQKDEDYLRLPLIDCALMIMGCNGGIRRRPPWAQWTYLAEDDARFARALRAFAAETSGPHIGELNLQLAALLSDIERDRDRPQMARTLAATGETNGLIFAYTLRAGTVDPADADSRVLQFWLEQAAPRIDQRWQVRLLAESCNDFDGNPACAAVIRRLQELDPDNGFSWLYGLHWSLGAAGGDPQLLRAARSPRMDQATGEILDAALAFGRSHRLQTGMDPDAFALEIDHMRSHDWMFNLRSYCYRSQTLRDAPAMDRACADVFQHITAAHDKSLFSALYAPQSVLQGSDDPSMRKWAEQNWRNVRWVLSARSQLPVSRQDVDPATHVRLQREHGQYAYYQALLRAQHIPVEAPTDFVTAEPVPWPRHRASTAGSPVTPPQ